MTTTPTDQYRKLAEDAKAMAEAATPGPWGSVDYRVKANEMQDAVCTTLVPGNSKAFTDATFVAASRTLVPDLAAALIRALEALEEANKCLVWCKENQRYGITGAVDQTLAELERILQPAGIKIVHDPNIHPESGDLFFSGPKTQKGRGDGSEG